MARAAAAVRPFKGVVYALEGAEEFAKDMSDELGLQFDVADSAEKRNYVASLMSSTLKHPVGQLYWKRNG